ncbi:MAG: glycosyltransferase [Candidatus Marinimicrobia bacterium]|jgi:abequosyltransferase|nr:glycosyltransferase [Candidatus Neomarinimicrobiota bacterium]
MHKIAPAQLLSIVVPTCNRSDFIDFFLQTHIPVVEPYGITIHISDNASTDDTVEVIEKWQKCYAHLHFSSLEEHIWEGVQNYEKALSMSTTEYTWLIGDSYEIPDTTLDYVLNILSATETHYEFMVLNLVNQLRDIPERVYTEPNAVLEDLAWMMGCVGCTIFHRSVISNFMFQKERVQSSACAFCHVSFVLRYMANYNASLYWVQSSSIVTLKTRQRKHGWGDTLFWLLFDSWPQTINSLPEQFSENSKNIALRVPANSKLLGWRNIVNLRAQNALNSEKYTEYCGKMETIEADSIRLFMRVVLLVPVPVCKAIISGIEWARRKKYQISKILNPDLVL